MSDLLNGHRMTGYEPERLSGEVHTTLTFPTPNHTVNETRFDSRNETDPGEEVIFGSIMVLYSLLAAVPYSLCLFALADDSDMITRPCYRIVFSIGIADILQLICNGVVGGAFSLLHTSDYPEFNKRVGSILKSCWMSYSILVNLFAFNRYVQICWTHKADAVFTRRKTSIMIGLCWMYGCVWFVVCNTPLATISYTRPLYVWAFEADRVSSICNFVVMGLDLLQLTCTVIWYICVLVALRSKAREMMDSADIQKQELSVLMQSVCICFLYFCTCFGFFVVPLISTNRYATFASNLIWLINCSLNPVIYLTFNKRLRRKTGELVRCDESAIVSPMEPRERTPTPTPEGPVELNVVPVPIIQKKRSNHQRRVTWQDELEQDEGLKRLRAKSIY